MVQDTDNPIQGGQDDTQVPNTSIPPSLPGGIPQSPAPNIPDWYKTGWRAVSGIDRPPVEEEEEKQKSVLDMFLAEQYYGTWYHNAALICFVRNRR
jgi:hypothetical protein